MIEHVLLDMDGVLTDFQGAALLQFGWRPVMESRSGVILHNDEGEELTYPFGEWDIPTVLGIEASDFWSRLHECGSFFEALPRLPYIDKLIDLIRPTPFTICTSPSLHAGDATAKINWMRAYFGDARWRDYMVGHQKFLMAKPTHLLIDDSPKNCEAFREKGGQTFLWPQYWNNAHAEREQRFAKLAELLGRKPATT